MKPSLTFIQITDTHIGPQREYLFHGYHAASHLERLVGLINSLRHAPDFVIHSGDLVDDRSAESYTIAREILAGLNVPIYYVNGNHDRRALLREMMGAPSHPSGDPAAPLDYTFEVAGERFIVIDGWSPTVPDPLGQLSAQQLDWLRAEIQRDERRLTVFFHYVPFKLGSPWFDDHMILLNGEELHAALCPARDRLRGAFFGHAHHSYRVLRDGITYACAASGVAQFDWWPWSERPLIDSAALPAYQVVRCFADQVVVQAYTFTRPEEESRP